MNTPMNNGTNNVQPDTNHVQPSVNKVQPSGYLREVKPLLQTLLTRLLAVYPYASILACDNESRVYAVSKSGIQAVSQPMLSDRGFCVKVFDGKGYCEHSFTSLREDRLPTILDAIHAAVKQAAALPAGLSRREYAPLPDEEASLAESSGYVLDPAQTPEEEIIRRLTEITQKGYALHSKIMACNAQYSWQRIHKLFLSRHKDMEQHLLWSNGTVTAAAKKEQEVKYAYAAYSGLCGTELMDRMDSGMDKLIKDTVDLLDSVPIVPGEYDCICAPSVTGIIAHEAFGHGVEMDMFVKDRALAQRYIGQRVASDLVTMHDGAAAAKEVASYFFDDEGVTAQDTVIIRRGILERGISDSQSAMALGTPPTANGRRQGFDRKAYTRMTNTFFQGGTDKLEDMIASISHGYLLDVPSSGMEDPKNWGIQCMVSIAREIRDGRLTGKVCSPIVLTGYVPDLLQSISMVSETVELSGTGFCGKGYKEFVKVSDGGPYIKARVRLG